MASQESNVSSIFPRLYEHNERARDYYLDQLTTTEQMLARLTLQAMGQEPLEGFEEAMQHAIDSKP